MKPVMHFRHPLTFAVCLALGAAPAPGQSGAEFAPQPSPPVTSGGPNSDPVIGPLLLRDVSLDQMLELLERWTGKTLLRPQALPATTVSLNLKAEVTERQAIRAVETLLSMNGVALTPLDDQFIKVTPLNNARLEAPELITGPVLALEPSGRVASKLFRLQFLRVGEFLPQLAGQLNSTVGGPPAVFEKSNAILITDTISNLQRVETLMNQLDRPESISPPARFYPLKHAKAAEVVSKLKVMLSGPQQAALSGATNYHADERSNQIILFADPGQIAIFEDLINRLDVRSGQDTRHEIIALKHATAKDVATLLTQLVAGQNAAARQNGQDQPAPAVAAGPNEVPPAALDGLVPPQHRFSALITILPEDRGNSIVATGTDDDLRLIQQLVARLDVLLAQVRIEVVIAEVSLSDNQSTGIRELGLKIEGDKLVGFSAALAGLTVKDAVITRPGQDEDPAGFPDLAAQLTVATTPRKSNANILSVPTITTMHNREGRIFVGEQRPVISSYLNDAGGQGAAVGSGYRSTVSSKDIGIQMSVKPLIGADGSVQLEIKQEVNDILGEITIDGNPQPRIGRRSTESYVSARSGEIIVLGGLQRTSSSRSTSRLGPIPIIGTLLGSRSKEKTRTDLVFFLRPTVLANAATQDNAAALRQVESFPKAHRDEVKAALQPAAPAPSPR